MALVCGVRGAVEGVGVWTGIWVEGTRHLSQGASEGGAEANRHLYLPPYTGSVTAAWWQQDCGGLWRGGSEGASKCRGESKGTHP